MEGLHFRMLGRRAVDRDKFLTGSRFPYTYQDWRLPDGQSVHYKRISPGTGFADAIFGAVSSSRIFANSRVNWNGFGWDWTFPEWHHISFSGSLQRHAASAGLACRNFR
jgi:hypothetical protein